MWKNHSLEFSKQLLILTIMFACFLLIVATFSVNIEWPAGVLFIDKYIYQHRLFTDFFQFGAVIIAFLGGNILFKYLGYLFALMFTFFYYIQSQAYAVIGKYLPSIALENIDHVGFLDLEGIIFSGLTWLTIFLLMCCFIHPHVTKVSVKSSLLVAVIMLLISIVVKNDEDWLSKETLENRFQFYNAGIPGVENKSPLGELFETFAEYSGYLKKQNFISENAASLSHRAAEFAYHNYQTFGVINREYTLVRNIQFKDNLTFIDDSNSPKKAGPNIIVFFVEGMSARLVQPYYDNFPNLTPNINIFSERAIKVNNYYNHTFATYRGLAGQFCSLFPVGRLYEEVSYHCLGHILNGQGYQSRFMVSQDLSSTDLDRIAYQSGFDDVDGSSELKALLSLPNTEISETVPDRILIDGLIQRLRDLEQAQNKTPYFIGLYNFETHTGVSLIEKSTVYTGSNDYVRQPSSLLNTFHNFDKEFGRFWQYFKSSQFYNNTIVVLTSDHATYPSREFNRLMRDVNGYTGMFIDEIPLLIYHPKLIEAIEIDAEKSNSLDLAPSLLHLLNFDNVKAPFLGESVFSSDKSAYARTAGTESEMWFIGKDEVWGSVSNSTVDEIDKYYPDEVSKYEFIQYIESLERNNKIWPEGNQPN